MVTLLAGYFPLLTLTTVTFGYLKVKWHCNNIESAFKYINMASDKLYSTFLIRVCEQPSTWKVKN
jgi:hypothetical protein